MYTAGPSGVVTVPCLKPRFLVASIARKLLGDGSVGSCDLGIIEQQLNQCSNQLGSRLCPVVMHSPVTGLFRVLLDRFLPTIRPRFQEQRTTGHTQSALHSALQCME